MAVYPEGAVAKLEFRHLTYFPSLGDIFAPRACRATEPLVVNSGIAHWNIRRLACGRIWKSRCPNEVLGGERRLEQSLRRTFDADVGFIHCHALYSSDGPWFVRVFFGFVFVVGRDGIGGFTQRSLSSALTRCKF